MAVRGIELLVIHTKESKTTAGAGSKLRVVQWVFDRGTSVRLERRAFFVDQGEIKTGKAEGLSLFDLELLRPHWKKIVQLMKNPPAVQREPAAPKDEPIEEVPF